MYKNILYLLCLLSIFGCKTGEVKSQKSAFNEGSLFGSRDRIYMVYDDKVIIGTNLYNEAFETNKVDLISMSTPDINTQEFYNEYFTERMQDQLRADDSLPYQVQAIACFNEPREDDFCAPLPSEDFNPIKAGTVVVGSQSVEIINRRTNYLSNSTKCTYKDPSTNRIKNGIKANHRFRKADFGELLMDMPTMVGLGDQQRTGKCVPMFGSTTIYDGLSVFDNKVSNYSVTTAEKFQATVSTSFCAIQAFGWVGKGLQKIGVISSSNKVLVAGTKLVGNIQVSLLEHISKIVTKLGNTTLGQTLVSKILIRFGTGAAGSLVLTPQLSKIIAQYFGNDVTDQGVKQMSLLEASEIAKKQIAKLSLTHEGKMSIAALDALESSQLVSEAEKSALGFLSDKGLTPDQIAYSALTVSSFFIPGISCVLAAKDISDILAKKYIQESIVNLQTVSEKAKLITLGKLEELGGERFKKAKVVFETESQKNSPLYFKNKLPELIKNSTVGSAEANAYQLSEFYLRIFNIYFAKNFNESSFGETFSHGTIFGTTKAFEEYVKIWSELEKESQTVLSFILNQRLLIASTVKLTANFVAAANEEGKSPDEALREAEENFDSLFNN